MQCCAVDSSRASVLYSIACWLSGCQCQPDQRPQQVSSPGAVDYLLPIHVESLNLDACMALLQFSVFETTLGFPHD